MQNNKITPYEYYTKRNQLLIALEQHINASETPSEFRKFADNFSQMTRDLDEAYDRLNVCTKTGEPLT